MAYCWFDRKQSGMEKKRRELVNRSHANEWPSVPDCRHQGIDTYTERKGNEPSEMRASEPEKTATGTEKKEKKHFIQNIYA